MNLLPIIENLRIVTKDTGVAKFGDVMNYAQREVVEAVERQWSQGKPARIIVLKARQIGISTVAEAIVFAMSMFTQNLRSLVIAHELDASEHLLSITTNYWNSWDLKPLFTPKHASTKRLGWKETNSTIQITTAKNVATGRSRTIHVLHGSEVAFWPDPDTLMTGLRQSVPNTANTLIILESTANGLGDYFNATWDAAVAGENEYIPLFFPWHRHPEYTAEAINLPFHPLPPNPDPEDAKEELHLKAMGIGDNRLAWRRWAIKNLAEQDINKFHQEYPSTPEEAFLSSGTNIFSLSKLREVYDPMPGLRGRLVRESNGRVRMVQEPNGPFKMFKRPSDDPDYGVYMVSGDPTRTTRGDPACAQVINRRTWEQVGVYRARIDPASFAEELAKIASYYNQAMICPETTGPGFATIGALLQMGYPHIWNHQWADKAPGKVGENFGWDTSNKRKHWAIGNLQKAVIDGDIVIHDSETFNELKNYVTLPNGEMGPNSRDGHDDTVMAMAIALTATITEAPTIPAYGAMSGPSVVQQVRELVAPVWEEWEEERNAV
jgi:hypothetical protein